MIVVFLECDNDAWRERINELAVKVLVDDMRDHLERKIPAPC